MRDMELYSTKVTEICNIQLLSSCFREMHSVQSFFH